MSADSSAVGRTDPAIEVRELRRRYGDFEAVKGVSFEVAKGELFALLGTNGAGKITTIEVLEGFRPPSDGSVRVLGFDPHRERNMVRPHIGIMLQDGGFFPDLSVAETISFWRDISGKEADRDILERAGLDEKADVKVRQLSGGQKRRLDLAVATLSGPRVLFLDEPTTGMDPEGRRATWQLIQELVACGTTVLLTTHYLEEAERLADHMAIMHEGRLAVSGTLGDVIAHQGNRIRFQVPARIAIDGLPLLHNLSPAVGAEKGRPTAEYALDAAPGITQAALASLLTWAAERRVVLDGLEVRAASLEDVFLEVAGAA